MPLSVASVRLVGARVRPGANAADCHHRGQGDGGGVHHRLREQEHSLGARALRPCGWGRLVRQHPERRGIPAIQQYHRLSRRLGIWLRKREPCNRQHEYDVGTKPNVLYHSGGPAEYRRQDSEGLDRGLLHNPLWRDDWHGDDVSPAWRERHLLAHARNKLRVPKLELPLGHDLLHHDPDRGVLWQVRGPRAYMRS